MKKNLLLLLLLLCSVSTVYTQIKWDELTEEQLFKKGKGNHNYWSITIGYGPLINYTDVLDYTLLPKGNWRFGPSINFARQLGRTCALDAHFLTGSLYGQKYQRYFEADINEFTLNFTGYINQWIIGGPPKDKWNFYAKIGLGAIFFRSQMKHLQTNQNLTYGDVFMVVPGGYPHNYTGWGENSYLVMGYDTTTLKKINRQSEIIIPIGVGVRYRINKSFDLGFEATLRNLTADNLDVDMTGADNDSYMYAAFSLTYKLGKKDKRHASWTYKDPNLDFNRDRARDPLAEKLDSLAKRLEYIAANDSVVNDTVRIFQSRMVRKESFAVSVFFDFDKNNISDMSHRTISNIARYMKANPDIRVLIQGHCDFRGSYDYNVGLSTRRCNAVKDVLVKSYGIDASRFDIDPRGKTELLSNTNNLPKGVHLVNRRVDVFPIIEE